MWPRSSTPAAVRPIPARFLPFGRFGPHRCTRPGARRGISAEAVWISGVMRPALRACVRPQQPANPREVSTPGRVDLCACKTFVEFTLSGVTITVR